MSRSLASKFPSLYRRLLPDFFLSQQPEENKATCATCPMCPPPDTTLDEETKSAFFLPSTKCCTYHPYLFNFLVGSILREAPGEGQQRVRQRLMHGLGVNPRWLRPSKRYHLLYSRLSHRLSFGRSPSMRCPFYAEEKGGCTVWPHWEATCATFFCKHDAGRDGREFWKELREYIRNLEEFLAEEATRRVAPELLEAFDTWDFGDGEFSPEELEELPPKESTRTAMWGAWRGREEEYYIACARAIEEMTKQELDDLLAGRDQQQLETLRRKYTAVVAPTPPEILCRNPKLRAIPVDDENVILVSYSQYDPLQLPASLVSALSSFDGQTPNKVVIQKLKAQAQIELDDEGLAYLYQFRILVAAP